MTLEEKWEKEFEEWWDKDLQLGESEYPHAGIVWMAACRKRQEEIDEPISPGPCPKRRKITLEEVKKRFKNLWSVPKEDWDGEQIENDLGWLIQRVKELEDGIRKHRDKEGVWSYRDEALYKLLEE